MSDYGWIDLGNGRQVFRRLGARVGPARSDLPSPMLCLDSMDPLLCMADGRTYDSKSAMSAAHKAAGMTEIGNDPSRLRPKERPTPDRSAIRQSLEKSFARVARGETA